MYVDVQVLLIPLCFYAFYANNHQNSTYNLKEKDGKEEEEETDPALSREVDQMTVTTL